MFVSASKALKHYDICRSTLKTWADNGRIRTMRTPGNTCRYWCGKDEETRKENIKKVVCYARVSSNGQKDDLVRQKEYFRREYPGCEIVSDIGSGDSIVY